MNGGISMKKKILLLLILIISVLFTTSCWSRREIEELAFVIGIGISKTEEGLYTVVAQLANPSNIVAEAPEQRSVYTIVKSEGLSIFDALRNLSLIASRRLYIAHIKTILLDEVVAREGVAEIVGFLVQDMETRLESNVFITKLPPEEIFDTPNTVGAIPSFVLEIAAKNYGANSKIYVSDLQETVEAANNPVINYVTTLVEKVPTPSPKEMQYFRLTRIAVFDHDKLAGYLDYEEGQAFNFITNNFRNGILVFKYATEQDTIAFEVLESSTDITPKYENNRVSFDIAVSVEGNIAERISHEGHSHEIDIELVKKQLDKVIEDKLSKAVYKAQQDFGIDYFNLSGDFFRKYPKEFKEMKENWNEVFSTATINIKVDTTVVHTALNLNRGRI